MPTGHYLTQEQIAYIRKNFANTPNRVLAGELGISMSAVSNIQHRYRLMKSPEHLKAMHRLSGLASADSWGKIELTPEVLAKRATSYRQTFREEKARRTFGLGQKTKIKIRICPRAKTRQSYYLRRRGYIVDEAAQMAYWTDITKRATRLENKPRKYYGFKMLDMTSELSLIQ